MIATLEATLLRALLEDPWDDIAPADDEALAAYLRTLWALVDYDYTDAGIEAYELTLAPGERFDTVARFRSFFERELDKRRQWLFSKAGNRVVLPQRRIVR